VSVLHKQLPIDYVSYTPLSTTMHEDSMPIGDRDSFWTEADSRAQAAMFMRLGIAHFSGPRSKDAQQGQRDGREGRIGQRQDLSNSPA
jgi:hypothetical protein